MKNLKVFTDDIEQEAINQINELLDQDAFKDSKIRIMPDVHAGKGCVIGFTGNLGNKVIPNIVGVDIGCGMLCVELGNIDLDLERLDKIIREYVPSGFEVHDERKYKFLELQDLKCYRELKDTKRLERSIGTLGGGNHFIEIDIDEDNNKYLVIHTGSRNLGKQVAEYYQELANQLCNYNIGEYKEKQQELIKTYKEQDRKQEIQSALMKLKEEYKIDHKKIPKDLAYLEGQYREDYLHDMKICQEFAKDNRLCIAKQILCNYFQLPYYEGYKSVRLRKKAMSTCDWYTQDMIERDFWYFETIHNYISFEDNIVRKGAISAKKGEMVLIPMNMRDGCIIGVGKGNDDWNQSAPHGAGRIMSRMKAKETFNLDEYKESMKDIYTTSINENTIDEAPFVYKPMQEIIDNIGDTVDIIKIIKPIYNFKASD
jgi:RNA-splicing ligase RtcB|nr:MAG TPA: tRNA-splicing ligase RtcB [Bacteriophage sp.]